ncbi:MAG: hypothetical protein COV76_07675 [Candidatus Omnitrophica bacterium CG11_big_fil_rev_8_21_14_0_20_64_10]|nr:MAG: hypothetical protein COV76_07675 [Candidatus Omnitrophica bacterium CG11_big_fil_rev_8_21_14_0_20_64_10]
MGRRGLLLPVLLLVVGCQGEPAGPPARNESQPAAAKTAPAQTRPAAPDFQVTRLDGEPFSLAAQRGKVVLVDFWATWCPPCVAEVPHFKELYPAYRDRGFEMIALSVDEQGERVVRSFAARNQLNYPVAMAGEELPGRFGGIRGLPTTFLIDKEGRIAETHLGYREKTVFIAAIERLLNE